MACSPQMPAREATLRNSTAVAGVRATCAAMSCRLTPSLWCKGQHDRADHRGQQDQPGRLEEVDIVRVEHARRARAVLATVPDGAAAGGGGRASATSPTST